jgi:ABC-type multidrug transport system permease subunit
MGKLYAASIIMVAVILFLMVTLFAYSLTEIATGHVKFNETPQYMMKFLYIFLALTIALCIALTLMALSKPQNL